MAELTLEKCQSFPSSEIRNELNSIIRERSSLNSSHFDVFYELYY